MQILINTPESSLDAFERATGVDFVPLGSDIDGKESVAVVVQGNSFEKDILSSIRLGIPVVVVAGNNTECAEQAVKNFIPERCIILKQGSSVVTADGEKIADTVGGGIGVKAVVKAAEYALKNKLYPEPLVWFESEPVVEFTEPVIDINDFTKENSSRNKSITKENESKKSKEDTISFFNQDVAADNLLNLSKKFIIVFKTTPDAESGKAAYSLTAALNGVHAELAEKPLSYTMYGDTITDAVATGRYITSNGKTLVKGNFLETNLLVVEIDARVLTTSPKLVDNIYKKADKIIHVVGDYEMGKPAIDAWKSNWKLDAIVSSKQNYEKYKKDYGDTVITDINILAKQLS